MSGAEPNGPMFTLVLVVLSTAVVGAANAACTADEFVAGVANVTDLQTSSGFLSSTLPIVGTPNNSTIFLPTDAAWTAFRAANGANAPDANRTLAILLYNSIITLGQASEAALVSSSPVQTSAAELLSALAKEVAYLPLAFANVSSVVRATDVAGNTVNLTASINVCDTQIYSTSGVLLPAASYAAIPETFAADVAALQTLAASPAPSGSAGTASSSSPAVTTPAAATRAGGTAASPASAPSPAPAPTVSTVAAPAPAPSAAAPVRVAPGCLFLLGTSLLTAVFTL